MINKHRREQTNRTEINVIDADVDVGTTHYPGTTHGQWLKTSIYTFVQLQIFNNL